MMETAVFQYPSTVSFAPPGAEEAVMTNQIVIHGVTNMAYNQDGVHVTNDAGAAIVPYGFSSLQRGPSVNRAMPAQPGATPAGEE